MTDSDARQDWVEVSCASVLEAMSVIPIAWLTAEQIAGEMQIAGADGRKIVPYLKTLLVQGRIIKGSKGKPTEYRLSEEEEERVNKAWIDSGGSYHLATDEIDDVKITTSFGGAHDPRFQTQIFRSYHDQHRTYCSTEDEANRQHAEAILMIHKQKGGALQS